MLSKDDVRKLADLALIEVPDDACAGLAKDMDAILGYVRDVATLAGGTSDAPAVPSLRNVMREDAVTGVTGFREDLVGQAPDRDGPYVRVKRIL